MGYKSAFREIMREYEADRDRAAALKAARRETVYKRLPRVRDIDMRLTEIGLRLVRESLAEDGDSAVTRLRTESQALQDEKAVLLKSNGVPDNYFTAVYHCQICADTGYIELPNGAPERCRCLKQRLIDKYYDLSNLKGLLAVENFDTFDLRYYSGQILESEGLSPHANMQTVYQTAMQFVLQFDNFQNLLLYGETGLGKTFLCNCIAKDLLDQGRTVLYVTAPRLFKIIEDYRFNREDMEEPDEMLDAVTEVDLLILDDLGAEFSTVVTSAALFDIINQRLLSRKPTVISTNLSPSGLEAQYSERIVSRFLGHYKMLKFFGDDIRVKKKYAVKK